MAVDLNINLSKDLASTAAQRRRFYSGMLLYLLICAGLLVGVAYQTSVNVKDCLANNAERRRMLQGAVAVSGIDAARFRDPDAVYGELQAYSMQLSSLESVLRGQARLLPVIYRLFEELPEGVVLQNLSATKTKINFGMIMPNPSKESEPVKELSSVWKKNEELMKRVGLIRPVTSERREVEGGNPMLFMQFECVLKR